MNAESPWAMFRLYCRFIPTHTQSLEVCIFQILKFNTWTSPLKGKAGTPEDDFNFTTPPEYHGHIW
jgi:hypothetical protein